MASSAIEKLLYPDSVAVFGASDDMSKYGGRIIHYLSLHGFTGKVVPINSRRENVAGRKCYATIGDAPPVDVAVIALPAPAVPQVLRECAAAGVRTCVLISAGFAEAGADGALLQAEALEIARASGMRLVGPNCMGLMNLRNGMALTAARVFDAKPVVSTIGLICQSGALMLSVYNRAQDQGIGFSQVISVGNQADLELCDFLEYMIEDSKTEVICLHMEGVQNGPRFRELLRRSNLAGKPVVILKAGRSAQGAEVAKSHTGSLAGAYPIFEAACRQEGAVIVDDPDVMILTADMLRRYGPPPKSRSIAMLSPSGGYNGIVTDRFADIGLELATFQRETCTALEDVFPADHVQNPLDFGVIKSTDADGGYGAIGKIVPSDPGVGVTLVVLTTSPNYEGIVRALASALAAANRPALFLVTPGSVADGVRQIIRENDIPYCDRIDDAARLVKAYFSYAALKDSTPLAKRASAPTQRPSGYLAEPETKALLASAGVRVTRETVVDSAKQAAAAADAIGFPVVLKGVSDVVIHKSDAGIVRLNLSDRSAVEHAYDDIRNILTKLDPDSHSAVVAEMVHGELELIVGIKNDPLFGPVVLVGAGGVLVDLLNDVQLAPVPVTAEAARAMLSKLKVAPLLAGYRGKPALDLEAVVNTLVSVSCLAELYGEHIVELDINPLLVRRMGEGAIALDARSNFL